MSFLTEVRHADLLAIGLDLCCKVASSMTNSEIIALIKNSEYYEEETICDDYKVAVKERELWEQKVKKETKWALERLESEQKGALERLKRDQKWALELLERKQEWLLENLEVEQKWALERLEWRRRYVLAKKNQQERLQMQREHERERLQMQQEHEQEREHMQREHEIKRSLEKYKGDTMDYLYEGTPTDLLLLAWEIDLDPPKDTPKLELLEQIKDSSYFLMFESVDLLRSCFDQIREDSEPAAEETREEQIVSPPLQQNEALLQTKVSQEMAEEQDSCPALEKIKEEAEETEPKMQPTENMTVLTDDLKYANDAAPPMETDAPVEVPPEASDCESRERKKNRFSNGTG